MDPIHTSSVAIIDRIPECNDCENPGNFAFGWNILCMRCVFSKMQLVCDACGLANIAVTNYWDFDNPKLLTEYRCIECEVRGLRAPHTNFVTVSLTPSTPGLDLQSALMYITDTDTTCTQCGQPHSNGKVLMGSPMMSLCVRCSGSPSLLPSVTVRIYPGGRFMT